MGKSKGYIYLVYNDVFGSNVVVSTFSTYEMALDDVKECGGWIVEIELWGPDA